MALITRSPDLSMEQIPPVSNAFEIHKLADGSGMLVGFVRKNLKPQLTASERPKNVRIRLYSNPSIKAPHIVAVPLVKLLLIGCRPDSIPRSLVVQSCSTWTCRVPPTVRRLRQGPNWNIQVQVKAEEKKVRSSLHLELGMSCAEPVFLSPESGGPFLWCGGVVAAVCCKDG